ncbi:MAG: transposase [bacterium]
MSTFDFWPHLSQGWHRRGRQRAVPTPGQNRKLAVCAALRYGSGRLLWRMQPDRRVQGMCELVQRLLHRARHTGRKVVLVLDRGSPNHAKQLHRLLASARPWIEVFWLPAYCWELNLIERLWKHLKASRLANVLFASYRQFRRHVHRVLEAFASHSDLILDVVTRRATRSDRKELLRHT